MLSDKDAAIADALLAGLAPGLTYGQLRFQASKLALRLDPEAVRKRKEQAKRDAHVRCFREDSGNAGISGRELPSVEALAAMQHISDRARQLRAAGMPGTLEELKVRALLDLLREQDSRLTLDTLPAEDGVDAGSSAGPGQDSSPDGTGAQDNSAGRDQDGSRPPGASGRHARRDEHAGDGDPADQDSASDEDDLFGDDLEESGPDEGASEDEDPDGGDTEGGDPGDGSPGGPGGGNGPGSSGPGGPSGSGPSGSGSGTGPVLAALVNITIPYTI